MNQIYKYPRTQHLVGSKNQTGDEDLSLVPFTQIKDRYVVIEEKMDGSNCGISFAEGQLLLQSRGHYLLGGPREKQFDLFKKWSHDNFLVLQEVLGTRYVMFGEWMYAKHTIYYDQLPAYFMEFDILDIEENKWLDTQRRKEMIGSQDITSVKVLFEGILTENILNELITQSHFISDRQYESFQEQILDHRFSPSRCNRETDLTGLMEGLYIKVEEEGEVKGRYKYVRESFLTQVEDSMSHWMNRPLIPNQYINVNCV
jgi:hypothetical protein